jgi:CubicO group peptidase (beta-lactamase class C family)
MPVSQGVFSWGGAASTFFYVDREEDMAVVFMTQLVLSGTYPIRGALFTLGSQAIVD